MQRLDALVRNTPDSRFNRPSPRTRPFPPPDSLPPGPGTSVEFSSSRGRLAPNQSHLSFPQQPGAGFPKADPPTPESEVLSPVRGHDSQPTRIPGGGGAREGAHSPKRADLRKGQRGEHGTRDISPLAVASPERCTTPSAARGTRSPSSRKLRRCRSPGSGRKGRRTREPPAVPHVGGRALPAPPLRSPPRGPRSP